MLHISLKFFLLLKGVPLRLIPQTELDNQFTSLPLDEVTLSQLADRPPVQATTAQFKEGSTDTVVSVYQFSTVVFHHNPPILYIETMMQHGGGRLTVVVDHTTTESEARAIHAGGEDTTVQVIKPADFYGYVQTRRELGLHDIQVARASDMLGVPPGSRSRRNRRI